VKYPDLFSQSGYEEQMSNQKIETAVSQGAIAARVFAKTGTPQTNPYQRDTLESGWFDHGFRTELKRIGVLA
jgi:hypothetical protein